jgi:hypothetical protein
MQQGKALQLFFASICQWDELPGVMGGENGISAARLIFCWMEEQSPINR